MTTNNNRWTRALVNINACEEAVAWAKNYNSLGDAWLACQRGDWMLWLAGRLSGPPGGERRKPVVLAACECARLSLHIFERRFEGDLRPRHAIETAEAWAHGTAPSQAICTAAYAAAADAAYAAAADAATAAYAAPATATHAAAAAATAAYAAAAAATAAAAAAYAAADAAAAYAAAADAAYAAYAAADATLKTTLARCADIVRKHFPIPPDSK